MGSFQVVNATTGERVSLKQWGDEATVFAFTIPETGVVMEFDVQDDTNVWHQLTGYGLEIAMDLESENRAHPQLTAKDVKEFLRKKYQLYGLEDFKLYFGNNVARTLIEFLGRKYHYTITAWH